MPHDGDPLDTQAWERIEATRLILDLKERPFSERILGPTKGTHYTQIRSRGWSANGKTLGKTQSALIAAGFCREWLLTGRGRTRPTDPDPPLEWDAFSRRGLAMRVLLARGYPAASIDGAAALMLAAYGASEGDPEPMSTMTVEGWVTDLDRALGSPKAIAAAGSKQIAAAQWREDLLTLLVQRGLHLSTARKLAAAVEAFYMGQEPPPLEQSLDQFVAVAWSARAAKDSEEIRALRGSAGLSGEHVYQEVERGTKVELPQQKKLRRDRDKKV